jgi:Flp pilus assembly protein TadD
MKVTASVRRVVASVCAAGCLLGGGACRSASPRVSEDAELRHELRTRGLDPGSVVIPWQLNSEMRQWVHKEVPDNLALEDRLQRVLSALLRKEGLALVYQAGTTGTAQEVFASHRANCLGFTSIFVGMARELGVDVFYLDIGDVEKFEREGNLVVESGHITAGYGVASMLRILEFTPVANPNYRQLHRVSDRTAIALYYSNRGAELLRSGNERAALDWLRKAIVLDPELARGLINYGVALRRTGDLAGAEATYRKALEVDPGAVAAYQNLAALLYAGGRRSEADELMALSSKLDNRNPFNFLALGDVALGHGRTEEARGFYRKAQHLEGAEAEAEAALGQLALTTGDRRGARRWLHKAADRDSDNDRVRRLAAQLGEPLRPKTPRPAARPGVAKSPAPSSAASAPPANPAESPPANSAASPGARPAPSPAAASPAPTSPAATPVTSPAASPKASPLAPAGPPAAPVAPAAPPPGTAA